MSHVNVLFKKENGGGKAGAHLHISQNSEPTTAGGAVDQDRVRKAYAVYEPSANAFNHFHRQAN